MESFIFYSDQEYGFIIKRIFYIVDKNQNKQFKQDNLKFKKVLTKNPGGNHVINCK